MVFFSLTIESPESIEGDYDVIPAAFGPDHLEGVKRLELKDCGSEKTLERTELWRKMALVRQNDQFSDYEMCFAQQQMYADGVLVIKATREPPHQMVVPDRVDDRITIPCFCMSRADGQALSQACLDGAVTVALVSSVVDVWSFGNGSKGQLGLSRDEAYISVQVPRLAVQEKAIQSVACGSTHTVLLLDNGTLFAFGNNEEGQLGLGNFNPTSAPVFLQDMAKNSRVSSIACGATHTCAAGNETGMWTWGANQYAQLGHSEGEPRVPDPMPVTTLEDVGVKFIAAGSYHTMACAINHSQTANERAETQTLVKMEKEKAAFRQGQRNMSRSRLPAFMQNAINTSAQKASLKRQTKRDKKSKYKLQQIQNLRNRIENEMRTLYTWGDGGNGQLGHGEVYTEAYFRKYDHATAAEANKLRKFTILPRPRIVECIVDITKQTGPGSIGIITALAASGEQSALLTSKGKLLTWGKGELGRLGHGDQENAHYPVLVTGLNPHGSRDEPIKAIAVGQHCMMALARSLNLYAWGSNVYGEMGLPTPATHDPDMCVRFVAKPLLVAGASKMGIEQICCGDTHLGGVTRDGEVYVWGQDEGGRLGHKCKSNDCDPPPRKVGTLHEPVGARNEPALMAMGSSHTIILTARYPADDTVGTMLASSEMVAEDDVDEESGPPGTILTSCCIIA